MLVQLDCLSVRLAVPCLGTLSGNSAWVAGGPVFLHVPLTALSLQLLMFAEFLVSEFLEAVTQVVMKFTVTWVIVTVTHVTVAPKHWTSKLLHNQRFGKELTNHRSGTLVFNLIFEIETFLEVPVQILVLWKLPSVTRPSN